MNAREFQNSIRSAKDLWPKRAPSDSEWDLRLACLLILSRRKGLSEEQFAEFDELVEKHVDELLGVGERWLVSIADTYISESHAGSSAAAAMVAITAIRMVEKFHSAAYQIRSGRSADPQRADIHVNIAKRLNRIWENDPHLWAIFTTFVEQLASDKNSVIGKFEAMATKDIYHEIESCRKPSRNLH